MPDLDYGDILCDKTFNNSFRERLNSAQYNAALAITGVITVSSSMEIWFQRKTLSRSRL